MQILQFKTKTSNTPNLGKNTFPVREIGELNTSERNASISESNLRIKSVRPPSCKEL